MLSGRRWLQKISVARPLFTNQLWIWGVRGVRRATWTWLFQGDFDLKVFFSTYFFRQPHAQNHLLRRFWTIRDNLFNNFLEDTAKNYETNRSQIGLKHQKLQASTTSGPKIDDHYWPKRGSISLKKNCLLVRVSSCGAQFLASIRHFPKYFHALALQPSGLRATWLDGSTRPSNKPMQPHPWHQDGITPTSAHPATPTQDKLSSVRGMPKRVQGQEEKIGTAATALREVWSTICLSCGSVAADRVNRMPLFLAHKLLADVRKTRGRLAEDAIKTVADVEDVEFIKKIY